ncbi:MAG: PTS mannose/fructose/sorbose transporter subunit IIB [Calditrichaeota bacterium]|nr:MAG: PTS mannose/fructose/sorbose transporter subunit IIB [Calditrichota bacterium]
MPKKSLILRIDDRLIHGQVVVGWGSTYPIKHYIVGNDHIAQNEWEKNLLLMAASESVDTQVLTLLQTLEYIKSHLNDSELSMILIKAVDDFTYLCNEGLTPEQLPEINIGGIHYTEGREEILPYLFLNTDEIQQFRSLIQKGFVFYCQDVPNSASHNLETLLEKLG